MIARKIDLLLLALDQIIDIGLCDWRLIDWNILDDRLVQCAKQGQGSRQPGLPTRLVAGLFILKHMHNLSDEVLCARSIENPCYQYFCGELGFCHRLPLDRSSMTRRRQRLGEEQLVARGAPAISIDLAASLGTLEMLENASPNSSTNRDSTPTLSEDY